MALGDVTVITEGRAVAVEMLASATVANGVPSGTNGIETNLLNHLGAIPESIRVAIKSTAGSGTMTVTLTVWMRLGSIGWVVAKPLNASSTVPHTPVAIPETSADSIAYSEVVPLIAGADRIYLEIVAIAGTTPAVTGYAIVSK